jgi:hypothetical protein
MATRPAKPKTPVFWKSRGFWFAGLDHDPCPSCGAVNVHDEDCPERAAKARQLRFVILPVLAAFLVIGLFLDGVGTTAVDFGAAVVGCAIVTPLIRRWMRRRPADR